MNEHVEMAAGAGAWFVEQSRSACFEALHRGCKIRDLQRDVMQSFAALLNELRDHRIGAGTFQQLNARTTGRQHDDVDLFLFDGFSRAGRESELLRIKPERSVERPDCDAQVINFEFVLSSHR